MPSADPSNISEVIKIVIGLKPNTILDIGIGTGKYGHLFRDYLDGHWAGHAFHNRATWTVGLVGLEVHEQYITPAHEYIYSQIWIAEAYKYLSEAAASPCFDLVFMGDVLEHFTKEQGIELIKLIRDKWLTKSGSILISTPNFQTRINDEARIMFGNRHEMHLCRWYKEEFRQFNMKSQVTEARLLTVLLTK